MSLTLPHTYSLILIHSIPLSLALFSLPCVELHESSLLKFRSFIINPIQWNNHTLFLPFILLIFVTCLGTYLLPHLTLSLSLSLLPLSHHHLSSSNLIFTVPVPLVEPKIQEVSPFLPSKKIECPAQLKSAGLPLTSFNFPSLSLLATPGKGKYSEPVTEDDEHNMPHRPISMPSTPTSSSPSSSKEFGSKNLKTPNREGKYVFYCTVFISSYTSTHVRLYRHTSYY